MGYTLKRGVRKTVEIDGEQYVMDFGDMRLYGRLVRWGEGVRALAAGKAKDGAEYARSLEDALAGARSIAEGVMGEEAVARLLDGREGDVVALTSLVRIITAEARSPEVVGMLRDLAVAEADSADERPE